MKNEELIRKVLQITGFKDLNPVQKEAVKKGLLNGKNLVVFAPTASGKTLAAELAALRTILNNKEKVVYMVPLVALANEKYDEFKRKYSQLGIKVALSVGDFDSSDPWLKNYDFIIVSNEKCLHPDEKIIVIMDNELKIYKISEFFNEMKKCGKTIITKGKVDIIPNKKIYTVSYSVERNEILLSPIISVVQAKDKRKYIKLYFEGGKELCCTPDHPLFILRKGNFEVVQANQALGAHVLAFIDLSKVVKTKVRELDLFELFKKNRLEGEFFCRFSSLDINSLIDVLQKRGKTKRRAKERAKWYAREGIIPMETASQLGRKVKITHIFGRRRDSLHFIPRKVKLEKNFGKLIGYYVSEGSAFKSRRKFGYAYLRIPTKSNWIKKDIISICQSLKIPYRVYENKISEIRIISKPLYWLFAKVWKLGKKAEEKKLPDFVFFAPVSFIQGLLSALFAGDGGRSPTAIEYSTKSKLLALQFQILLSRFNVHAAIYPQRVRGYESLYWRIVIKGSRNVKRLLEKGFLEESQQVVRAEKIASTKKGRDDQFSNVPSREIISTPPRALYRVPTFNSAFYRGHRVNRKIAMNLADLLNDEKMKKIVEAPFAYLRVVNVEKMEKCPEVYNLQTEEGNFFTAEGTLLHNCDSLIRHGADWIRDIGLIVADEIHLLDQADRGPTLEITLTLLRELVPNAQILALSATVKNAKELAKWLNADTVISEWRPVKLYKGVSYPYEIKLLEKEGYKLDETLPLEASIIKNTLGLKKQALFFVSTRKSAESLAEKLGKVVKQNLSKNEERELEKLASEIENVLEVPTKQCKRLAQCIMTGSAFHHSGLLYKQRVMIEENFRNGLIKVIVATPGLAYGVNLPAFRVIMRDLKRYHAGVGAVFVPILDVQQMLGRAGRPSFDLTGEGIILAKNEEEAEEIIDHYFYGELEEINSKLAVEPVLRMHTLALIASEFCKSQKSLLEFFGKTFFAFQYGEISAIAEKILDVLKLLIKWKFVDRKKDRLVATRMGRRVSELYIDPLTAHHFIECLTRAKNREIQPFSFLQAISTAIEMRPLLNIKTGELSELAEEVAKRENQFLQEIPNEWDLEYDEFLKSVKTALMFEAWINEASEDYILTKFKVAPGEFYGRRHIADWLVYSLQELALLLGYKGLLKDIRKLRVRLEYGVKEELIPLVRLRNIGRVRARILWSSNLRSLSDLRKIPYESLSRIIGPQVAKSIKDQLEGKREVKRKEVSQVSLANFK